MNTGCIISCKVVEITLCGLFVLPSCSAAFLYNSAVFDPVEVLIRCNTLF